MENEKKTTKETKNENNAEAKKLNLPVIISAAVGGVAVVAIVIALILGGGKDNKGDTNNGSGEGTSDVGGADGEVDNGILNEDNIDPDGWTKVDK